MLLAFIISSSSITSFTYGFPILFPLLFQIISTKATSMRYTMLIPHEKKYFSSMLLPKTFLQLFKAQEWLTKKINPVGIKQW